MLRLVGTQDFALVGVLASLVRPIARAGVGVFAVSTFDTDYLLIKAENLDRGVAALRAAGHAAAGLGTGEPPSPDEHNRRP